MGKYIEQIYFKDQLPKDSYLSTLPIVCYLKEHQTLTFHQDVTFLVGENGSGKSTLLEAIAVTAGFNPEGGTRNFSFSTKDTHSPLHQSLTTHRKAYPKDGFFLRAESFYNGLSYIEEVYGKELQSGVGTPYGSVSLHQRSHGESFLDLVQNRFRENSLYILDEPEAALSPSRQMVLMAEVMNLVKKGCQFIVATHSPILLTLPKAEIYELSEDGIASVSYWETEHFQVTKAFLNQPERMIHYLLEE